MSESEQAQAIAEIKRTMEIYKNLKKFKDWYPEAIRLLEIVDSQAQKIADLNRVGSNTLLALIEAQEKIADQAKEIERLKQRIAELHAHIDEAQAVK